MPVNRLRYRKADPVTALVVLCWTAYFTAYWGRLNYSACLVAILPSLGITKEQAGLASSCFYFAYGIGQLVSGLLAERLNPRLTLACSLALSALINLLFPSAGSLEGIALLWLLNGAVQSTLWAGIIRLYADYIPRERMYRAIVAIHTTGAAGTLAVYALSSACVALLSWQAMFYIAGAALLLMATVWFAAIGRVQKALPRQAAAVADPREKRASPRAALRLLTASGAVVCLFAAMANGALRDGATLWAPSFIHEQFGASASFSIFATLLLPLFGMLGAFAARLLNRRIPNALHAAALFFALAMGSLALIFTVGRASWLISCLLFALTTCSMAAVNTLIVSVLPMTLRDHGPSATIAGTVNSFCYVGSTLASYGLGALSQRSGWNAMLCALLACAGLSGALCALGGYRLARFQRERGLASIS